MISWGWNCTVLIDVGSRQSEAFRTAFCPSSFPSNPSAMQQGSDKLAFRTKISKRGNYWVGFCVHRGNNILHIETLRDSSKGKLVFSLLRGFCLSFGVCCLIWKGQNTFCLWIADVQNICHHYDLTLLQ